MAKMKNSKLTSTKNKLKSFSQKYLGLFRDDKYWKLATEKNFYRLREAINKETNWLTTVSSDGGQRSALSFHEQAIKYYEYKNMIIQRRSQKVIIFLTINLLIMTAWEIYLNFY